MRAQVTQSRWHISPLMKAPREKAKAGGLFTLFLHHHFERTPGLTKLEYACCAEIMGRVFWAAQTMNCRSPETGNIELLSIYANAEQMARWLELLLKGELFSAYSMTKPNVVSADAMNISFPMDKVGVEYVLNGGKIVSSVFWNPEIKLYILMARAGPQNENRWRRRSRVLVPSDSPGLTITRNVSIIGYDHATGRVWQGLVLNKKEWKRSQ
ncbi:acyl-CoA dehydrogenase/oxidase [Aspergillus recurvatus]